MPKRLLVPGRTVWRVERCPRAAVLIDASSCFGAMRSAFLAARRSIYVVGWDIDSRTELVGEAPPTDGLPTAFGPFLIALLARKPEVRVHLLLWDYSLVYAHEREKLPRLHLDWQMPPQVAFRLDNTVSVGSSQHQKLVIVDDTLAFSGGLDLTIRRWDTPGHAVEQARRVDPDRKALQAVPRRPDDGRRQGGAGARRPGSSTLVPAGDEGEPAIAPVGDPWPADVAPDFTGPRHRHRTHPATLQDENAAHEVEAAVPRFDRWAERTIYIENQFTTSARIAAASCAAAAREPSTRSRHRGAACHDSFSRAVRCATAASASGAPSARPVAAASVWSRRR